MLRTLVNATVILTLAAGPAAAQQMSLSPFNAPAKRPLTQDEIEAQKKKDRDYKAAMDKIPDKKPVDPWGGIRDTSTTTPAKKQQ
jgi:hypothetical protein